MCVHTQTHTCAHLQPQLLVVGFVPSEGGEPRLIVRKPTTASSDLRASLRSRGGSGSRPHSAAGDGASNGGLNSSQGGHNSSASVSMSAHSDEVLGRWTGAAARARRDAAVFCSVAALSGRVWEGGLQFVAGACMSSWEEHGGCALRTFRAC